MRVWVKRGARARSSRGLKDQTRGVSWKELELSPTLIFSLNGHKLEGDVAL